MGKQHGQARKKAQQNQRSKGQAQSTEQDLAPIEGQSFEAAGAASAKTVDAAAGAGMAGFAQAQMMNIAMTQGNAAAQAAMKSANATKAEGAGVEEEEGGHATEEPAVDETAADPVADEAASAPAEAPSPEEEEESTTIDGGTEVSEGAAGDEEPPVGTEALPGGEPNPSGESEEVPELGAEEKEGEEAKADAEGEEKEAEEGEVAAAEGLMAGVLTAPLMPTMTPTLGVGAAPALNFTLTKEEDNALVETTGMAAEQHTAVGNTALAGLASSAAALQAESVVAATNAGLAVKASIDGLLPGLDQEASTIGDQVGQAFDAGTATLQGAAETARVQIEAGSTESQAGVESKRVENIGQIDAVTTTTQAGLQNKKQTWSQSFDSLETGYAEKFEKAPEDAGDAVLSRKQEIGEEQATGRGPGGAVSRLMDKKRTQAGVIQAEQAAERIRVEGKIEGPTPVEEIGEPGMVEEWVEPLEERVGTFREESVSALTETATASKDAIATGGEEWKTQVELDEQGAVSQMDEDKLAAQGEVSAVGVQLRGDLESQMISQESLFTEASAQFADSYRLHVETVSQEVSALPLVTGGEAEAYVADQEVALQALHQENLATLGSLVDTTTTELTQQVDTGRVQLQTLLSENQTDIEGVTATKVESFNEMGVAYSDSLGGMSDAIQGEMQLWTDPLESQSSDFVEAAETSLQTQHDSADEELSQSLGQYEECLDEQVSEVGEHVEADPAGAPADETLEKICEDSKDAMAGMGTKENKLYSTLRLIEDKKKSPEFAAAVESKWSDVNRSDNESLLAWIDGDMDGREYRIAYNYYKGNTSKAAELELDYCTAWYNDDEAQIEAILRGLDKDQLEEMQARDSWKEVGDELQDDLDGTDINVVDALLVNNIARADAYRLKDKVDAARRKNDHDALHDALAGMDPATRQTIVQEFSYIQTDGAVAGATEVELPEWEAAMSEMQTYVTRDIERTQHGQHGETYTYTNSITGANKNLAESLISSGNDSIESDVHRFEVERSRRGGPKEERLEQALYMSSGSQDALRKGETDPAFQESEEYKAALAEQEERERFEEVYAQFDYNDGKSVDDGIQEIYRGTEDGALEIEAHRQMLEDGTNSPEVVALITELSTNDAGTKDERLQRVWENLTPAQAAEARQIWQDRPDLGAGKDLEDFFFNDTFSELSGDDARKMQEKMLGSENYMNDEQLFELAELRADYQLGDSTYLSDEELNIQGHRDELRALIATVRSERNAQGLGDSAYEDGVFQGTAEQKERYAELNRYIGITVRQEMAREDMVAGYFTQAIAIVGGVIVIVLTGGGAAPLVIGLATAATGGASIAANQIIKGDRYGYEQALLDGGITVASALTAGTGAHLSRLNDVAKGGTGIVLAGRKLSEQSGKVFIALATDGTDAFVGSVLNDQTWEESGGGWNDVLLSTAKGTGMSLAGDAIGDGLDNSVLGKIAGEESSVIANMTQDAVKGYTEDFLKTGLSLTVDSATGKFHGDFGDALIAMNDAGMSGAGTSVLNEFFKRATPEGAFDGTALGQSSKAGTLNDDGSERTVGDALSKVGTGLSDQASAIPGELAQLHSDVTGLTALQNEFNAQLPGIVALHPDVVAQLADFESTEIEARTQGEADDKEQAASLEGTIQSEEGPEAIAEQVVSLTEDKQEVIENRADEGEAEIQAYVEASDKAEVELVEAFDASVVKIEEELSSQQDAPVTDAPVTDAPVTDTPQTQTSANEAGLSETGTAQEGLDPIVEGGRILGLNPDESRSFAAMSEEDVSVLMDLHKEGHDIRPLITQQGEFNRLKDERNTASVSESDDVDGSVSREIQERTRDFENAQDSHDLDHLYQEAAVADKELQIATNDIAGATGGEAKFPPGLKGRERAVEKTMGENDGDFSRLTDLSRSSIQYESMADLQSGLAQIDGQFDVVRIKDRFETPAPGGYRDMLLNVRMSNGHIVEIQLHLKSILDVKSGRGHEIYERTRSLAAIPETEGRELTDGEREELRTLTEESEQLYGDAFLGVNALEADGSAVAVETLRAESDPVRQAELATHLATLQRLTHQPAESLSKDELLSVVRANHALIQNYDVHDTELRRVVGEGEIMGWLGMTDRDNNAVDKSTTGGSIGLAENTKGMSVGDMISVLGLDYEGSRYVTQSGEDGESYEAVESLFYVETRMTSQMMENTYVPLGGDVYSALTELAKTDSQAKELLDRSAPYEVEGSERGPMQPYTGLGVTAPSDRLPDGRHALAPELMIAERISLPAGAQIFHQTKDGNPILVAEYKQDHEGGRYWDVSADCPEEYRVNFEQLAKKGK